ncbi:MAG: hypothetical protein QG602_4022 [Verrucomicrobiota bacterium]|nr:hypothetical protein [Verrucomicrobiota bacterium]
MNPNLAKTAIPVLLITMLAGVFAAELWLLRGAQQRADKALAVLAQKRQEHDSLARQTPAPTAEYGTWIATETVKARATLARLQANLAVADNGAEPQRPTDGYFALKEIWQKLARRSAEAGVKVSAGEKFSFASHAREGPAAEILPVVHRQGRLTERLVKELIDAGPEKLLAVKREEPGREGSGRETAETSDFHVPAPALLVRRPGLVETDAFRMEFTGRTSVLRNFLRALAVPVLPVIVRSVEVEPVAVSVSTDVVDTSHTVSKFSVLMEVPRLAAGPKP